MKKKKLENGTNGGDLGRALDKTNLGTFWKGVARILEPELALERTESRLAGT